MHRVKIDSQESTFDIKLGTSIIQLKAATFIRFKMTDIQCIECITNTNFLCLNGTHKQGWVKLCFVFVNWSFFLKKKTFFPKNVLFPTFTDHIAYSVVYTKNTAFGPFRRPGGISESRNSSTLSKSVAPIRLNLVPPKPDCPPYQ